MKKVQYSNHKSSFLRLTFFFGMLLIAGISFQSCDLLSENVSVEAVVSVDPEQAQLGQEINVDGSSSTSSDGSELSYSWNLTIPDGSSAQLENPENSRTSFFTDTPGDYIVELTVSSGDAEDTQSATVSVTSNTLEVQGTISSDETFTSEILYRVVGDLTVSNGAKLTIEPGTRVEFQSGTKLEIASNAILSAVGTEQDSIVFTGTESQTGWWDGIFVRETTHPENALDYVVVEYGGNSSMHSSVEPANFVVSRSLYNASISVNNSTFRHSGGFGLYIYSNGELPNSGNNTFTKNESGAAGAYTNNIHFFAENSSYTGNNNGNDLVEVTGNTLSSDVVWKAIEVPFVMQGESKVQDAELTIDAGTVLSFDAEAEFEIEEGAIIDAVGTEQNPILFTATVEQAGWWDGIFINGTTHPNNIFDNVIVEYGGRSAYHSSVEAANVTISRSLYNSSITIKNSTFRNSAGLGLYLHGNGEMPQSANNTYTSNEEGPVSVATNNMHFLDSGSSFDGNGDGNDYAWVRGTDSEETANWQALNVPYGMKSESDISNAEITIDAGARFAFDAEAGLKFDSGSQFEIVGTEEDPILFTGMVETPGWWNGIFVLDTTHPDNSFDNVVIEYGGNSAYHSSTEPANLTVGRSLYNTSLSITNSIIRNSDGTGIFVHSNSTTNNDVCSVNDFTNNPGGDCVIE